MAESKKHKEEKRKAAGPKGRTEVSLPRNRRLDASSETKDTEVELSGDPKKIVRAIQRVMDGPNAKKEVRVPVGDVKKAESLKKKSQEKVKIVPIKK